MDQQATDSAAYRPDLSNQIRQIRNELASHHTGRYTLSASYSMSRVILSVSGRGYRVIRQSPVLGMNDFGYGHNSQAGWMKYSNETVAVFAVSLALITLGLMGAIFAGFMVNLNVMFYSLIVLLFGLVLFRFSLGRANREAEIVGGRTD